MSNIQNFPTAACVFIRGPLNTVLAVTRRNKPDAWGLPGGKCDLLSGGQYENPVTCIWREVYEETGISLDPQQLSLVFELDCIRTTPEGRDFYSYAFLYTGSLVGQLQSEAQMQVGFVSQDYILNGPFAEYNRGFLKVLNSL